MQATRVVVIGAGVGGLCAAMELAARGLEVTVCERAPAPGGKMRELEVGGAWIDSGPTVLTMRWVFEELFERCGHGWPQGLVLSPLRTLARHAWSAGGRLDLHADGEVTAAAIGELAGAGEARRYREFAHRAREVYRSLERPFLRAARPSPAALAGAAGLRGLAGLARIATYATLWRALARQFHDPRLRQLFARYATYVGSSPFRAPATLMLIAHVEREGVWTVDGGMSQLARSLAHCAGALGARLRYGAGVARVLTRGGRAAGVELAGGERLEAQTVVCNADVSALGSGSLGDAVRHAVPATPPERRSLSALTWSLRAAVRGFPLARHNVFFGADYRAEFEDLFTTRRLPAAPTVYVCAQDRRDGDEPHLEAPQRLLCLVNAPATGDHGAPSPQEVEVCTERSFDLLERCGLVVERGGAPCVTTTPVDFEQRFPATGGALYGEACHGWRAPFTRPGARSRVPGLYLAGGSVHPGPGVPMAALSGHLAASAVLEDLRR